MTIKDLHKAMSNLATKRVAFWSEADFQFALAWELQQLLPQANIYLERCFSSLNYYVDIWIEENDYIYPIELKYKTAKASITQNGNQIVLKNHSAMDFGCYDYLKDIHRIENIAVHTAKFKNGYAIMLTNDSAYYKSTSRTSAYDNFKIYQGAKRGGMLTWGQTQKGTTFVCGSRTNFALSKSYTMNWHPYNNGANGFQYLISEV